ncbi:senescence-associated protein-domain-containing protein [Cladochytrium replicatum]|nr:senescence-associated protein-domain-containing protein [Cladochytrium replicatum]
MATPSTATARWLHIASHSHTHTVFTFPETRVYETSPPSAAAYPPVEGSQKLIGVLPIRIAVFDGGSSAHGYPPPSSSSSAQAASGAWLLAADLVAVPLTPTTLPYRQNLGSVASYVFQTEDQVVYRFEFPPSTPQSTLQQFEQELFHYSAFNNGPLFFLDDDEENYEMGEEEFDADTLRNRMVVMDENTGRIIMVLDPDDYEIVEPKDVPNAATDGDENAVVWKVSDAKNEALADEAVEIARKKNEPIPSRPFSPDEPSHDQTTSLEIVGEHSVAPQLPPRPPAPHEMVLYYPPSNNDPQMPPAYDPAAVSAESTPLKDRPRVARYIIKGSELLSNGIVKGSELIGTGMHSASQAVQKRLPSAATPATLSPSTKDNIRRIHTLSSRAVGVTKATTGAVIGTVGTVVGAVVRPVARVVSKKKVDENGNPKKPGVIGSIAQASIIAVGKVAEAGDIAVKSLMTDGTSATAGIVNKRYGREAAQATVQALGVAGNLVTVYIDATGMTRRAILLKAAKVAGNEFVQVKMKDGTTMNVKTSRTQLPTEAAPPSARPPTFPPPPPFRPPEGPPPTSTSAPPAGPPPSNGAFTPPSGPPPMKSFLPPAGPPPLKTSYAPPTGPPPGQTRGEEQDLPQYEPPAGAPPGSGEEKSAGPPLPPR